MWLKKLIAQFIKQNGRNPNAIETLQLKFRASDMAKKGKFLQFPPGGKGGKGPNRIMDELVDEQGNYIGDRKPDLREFRRREDLYEGLPKALRNVKNPEEVKKLLDSGAIKIGKAPKTKKTKAPVDPKFKRAVESQEERARLIKEFERRNKESAFNIAFKRYKEIDTRPMKMDELMSIYTNLGKYSKGKNIIVDDIADIQRGYILPNIGNRSREMLVNKLNKMIRPKKQPDPFKKASDKVTEQIEMDFTDWDPKGMAGGGLAYMLGEGGSPKDATNFLNRIAPQGERLAYINPKEEKMLKDAGGSGIMTQQGIPSFTEDDEDTGGMGHHGGGHGLDSHSFSGPSPDSGDDDKALSYVNWNQPTTRPGPTRSGGNDNRPWYQHPAVKVAGFMMNPVGSMIGMAGKGLYDQYMLDKALQGTSDYGYPSKVKPTVEPPRDNGGNQIEPWWLKPQAPSSLGMAAIKPKDDFDLYGVVEGRTPSRFYADGGRIKISPKIDITKTETTPVEGIDVSERDITYGGSGLYQGDKAYVGGDYMTGNVKVDVRKEGETLFKDTMSKEDLKKLYIGLGQKEGNRVEVETDTKGNYVFNIVRSFNNGGLARLGFDNGGFNKGRRNFLKLAAGLASLPFVGKLFKGAKPAAKALKAVETSNAAGMPAWFPKLVDKVIKEGTDVTKQMGTIEREIVHAAELPSGTKVMVTQDLTTGNTAVDIGQGKHGWSDGYNGQPTRLELTKGEWIEPTKGKKGVKTKDEFWIEEAEFTGGHPENIKFEESSFEKYGNHGSDFREVEKYATGKVSKESKAQKQIWEADWDDSLPDDYAKGGLAHMLGE